MGSSRVRFAIALVAGVLLAGLPAVTSPALSGTLITQLGVGIVGGAAGDALGWSVSQSSDGSRVAIGSPGSDVNGTNAGQAKVFEWDGASWEQLGSDITGRAAGEILGTSVSLSSDGTRVAIGAPGDYLGQDNLRGHVRVYDWDGTEWSQVGANIPGDANDDQSGFSVSLASDGLRVAIGAPQKNVGGNKPGAGQVRVYDWNGTAWTQVGGDIDGALTADLSGYAVSLSSSGARVAIGAIGNGASSGDYVKVYDWNGTAWTQVGAPIQSKAVGESVGGSVSLSSDGSRLGVGAPETFQTGGQNTGHVRVYDWNGTAWTQVGPDIDGDAAGDGFGWAVSLSADGSRIAVGAPGNDRAGSNAGKVAVYDLIGSSWAQIGLDITGEAAGDLSGGSVSLSANGARVAIGAAENDRNGADSGQTRVFAISLSTPSGSAEGITCCPGIFLHVAGSAGRAVEGTPVYHGSVGIAPRSSFTLKVQSMDARSVKKMVLATGITNGRGHLDEQIRLGALAPGSYKIVMTGSHPLGYPLVLTNHVVVDAAGKFVSVSPESLQPILR